MSVDHAPSDGMLPAFCRRRCPTGDAAEVQDSKAAGTLSFVGELQLRLLLPAFCKALWRAHRSSGAWSDDHRTDVQARMVSRG